MGWIRRIKFREENENILDCKVKQDIGRHLARLILSSDSTLYKQWFAGASNIVADSLSRDAYFLSVATHQKFLATVCPSQLPPNFQIKPLPKEICCFITSMLEQLPVKEQRLSPQKPSEIAHGNVGLLSALALELKRQSSLMDCQDLSRTLSCQHSAKQLEKQLSHQDIVNLWWKEQSTPPSHMWHRPLGQTIGKTPDWTEMVRNASSSKNNSEDIGIKMDL